METDSHLTIATPKRKLDELDDLPAPKRAKSVDATMEKITSVSTPVSTSESDKASSAIPRSGSSEEVLNTTCTTDSGPDMVLNVGSTPTLNESPPAIPVDNEIAGFLCNLRTKFNYMLQGVERSMKESRKEERQRDLLENLKQTVTDLTEDEAFERCEDYPSFFKKLRMYVDMFDPHMVSSLADTYGDDVAKSHMKKYEDHLEGFMKNTIIQELEGALKLAREGCFKGINMSHVIMKLPRKWVPRRLKDLSELSNGVFGVKSRVLQGPVEVKLGCIRITWYVLEYFVHSLREAAIERVDVLQREELILLRIGGVTVFQDGQIMKVREYELYTLLWLQV